MKIILGQAYSFHQLGKRKNQEDSRFPDFDKPAISQRFFVVCDGVGGCEKGEVASKTVCEAIEKAMVNVDLTKPFSNIEFSKVLDKAYDALDRKADSNNKEMATTLTFACFHDGGCILAHIGDSRIYQFRNGQGVIYRSEDHSLVNSMVHNGMITPDEALDNPQKHVITRFMEPVESDQNRCMAAVLNTTDVCAGDYIFMCTDGVYSQLADDEIADILFDDTIADEVKMSQIAQMCYDSDDNNTAVLIPVIDVATDISGEQSTESNSATKKLLYPCGSVEEIESIQQSKKNTIVKWVKKLFK